MASFYHQLQIYIIIAELEDVWNNYSLNLFVSEDSNMIE